MPYKDPERKRQWEREHRVERNARRRKRQLLVVPSGPREPRPAPDPISNHPLNTTGNVVAGIVSLVLVVAMILIARWSVSGPRSDNAHSTGGTSGTPLSGSGSRQG
jgi:hypothetical protein